MSDRLDLQTAKQRTTDFLQKRPKNRFGRYIPVSASRIADAIWPGNQMTPQGAGGAASRVLKQMPEVEWGDDGATCGWRLIVGRHSEPQREKLDA